MEGWQEKLQSLCAKALLSQRSVQLCSAAESLGVALWSEIPEVFEEMASMVGLRPLEIRRLQSQLASSV